MALTTGSRLGAYEIVGSLGAGGMGEVYRARDVTLDRDVAIKILPEAVAGDPERVARFQREAKTLAALNHPHIAQIYGFERSGSTSALVMELVAGEDLAERIARGPLPLNEALPVARQIADALEVAHAQGIIHRDLKPANVKVRPDGTIKVLDFGLAKVVADMAGSGGSRPESLANSPTLTGNMPATLGGVILGTAAYMSPEQARARTVDKRTDVWAFGCVLYEMLTGRPAFGGESVTDLLARVIEREPDWSALSTSAPAGIRRLLRRCLQKDPRKRLADMADARLEIEDALDPTLNESVPPAAQPLLPSRYTAAAIGLIAVAVSGIALWALMQSRAARRAYRPSVTYVAAQLGVASPNLAELVERFSVTPDGDVIVFVDRSRGGLFVRRPGDPDGTPIGGAPRNAMLPVISPDAQWVAYFTETALQKIPITGGTPTHILSTIPQITLTWGADDRLRFPTTDLSGIQSIASSGGAVEEIAAPPNTRIRRVEWLPNGRLLVSVAVDADEHIAVREADGTLCKLVSGRYGKVTPSGHLLYSRADGPGWSLAAAPFDDASATINGETAVLAREVPVQYATPGFVTKAGDLVYLRGSPRSDRRVVSLDSAGAERDVPVTPGAWVGLSRSPRGDHLALSRWDGARRTIWTFALDSHALTQLTYEGDTIYPNWFPDGRRLLVTYFNHRLPGTTIWSVATSGQGTMEPLFEHADSYALSTSADGTVIYYRAIDARGNEDIFSVRLSNTPPVRTALLTSPADEGDPWLSPNERWLAYSTTASGRQETRIAALSDLTASIQVSGNGGAPVRWSPKSDRLYYQDGDSIAVVEVGPSGPLLASRARAFPLPSDVRGRVDVMPDGKSAVLVRGGLMYSDLVVVQNALPRR